MGEPDIRRIRAGLVCFSDMNYPLDILNAKVTAARGALESAGLELVTTDLVRDDPAGKDVRRAIATLAGKEFDVLILCVTGWIPSHAVISVANEHAHKPMVLWGLTGFTKDGVLVTTAEQAGTSALRKPMADLGYRFKYVYDLNGRPSRVADVERFARAARAASLLRRAKMGMVSFRDMNLYSTLFDAVSLRARIGPEVEVFDMLEVERGAARADAGRVREVVEKVKKEWTFEKPADPAVLDKGARLYLAVDAKVRDRGYEVVSICDVEGMRKHLEFPPAMVLMLLTDLTKVPATPENDVLGGITQLMVRYLTGQSAAYLEFYEYMEDRVLMGSPDFVPSGVVDGPVRVIPTKFGVTAGGLLNVSKVRTGRVTMARLSSTGDRYRMHIFTGEAVTPRKWEEAGWESPAPQLPGLEIKTDQPVDDLAGKVSGQHYILSHGDHAGAISDLCFLLGIEVV